MRRICFIYSVRIAEINLYIYEHKNWTQFKWSESKISSLLAHVRNIQGRLIGKMEALGFDIQKSTTLEVITSDVLKSSLIEGENLNQQQVRSSIARRLGIEVVGTVPSERDVDGIVDMMLDATQNYEKPMSHERLYSWHAALFPSGYSGISKIKAGQYRDDKNGPMQVVSGRFGNEKVYYQAPDATIIGDEMNDFINWVNSEKNIDPVISSAIAHLWFVTVHPFEDGNGRIARAIADMMLARSDGTKSRFYSMSSQIQAERDLYYDVLEDTQKGDCNIDKWLFWYLNCLEKSINNAEDIVAKAQNKSNIWLRLNQYPLNARQIKILNMLIDGFDGNLTSSKWAAINKCSQDTASRDIDDLITKGILMKSEKGGRSTNYRFKDINLKSP